MHVLCRTPNNEEPAYNDLANADPSLQSSIVLAYQLGLMQGDPSTHLFRPQDIVSQEEFTAVVVRMILHSYLDEASSAHWYDAYMSTARDVGITRGS